MSSSAPQPALRIEQLAKKYQIYDQPHHRLLQMLWGQRRQYHHVFEALQDVTFEVAAGETLGIIGRNGAGKSTLLQLICGTLTPSGGAVEVRGRIAALLELGTGFNPDFTGRQNLGINAAILGLSARQIAECSQDIIAFADIGEHIDQPVKTYSSGMYVRLAFAIAVHAQPDILIVDEALAVGDALFQAKCMARMRRMLDDGMTLLFTSHDVSAIKAMCTRTLWLEKGRMRMIGNTADVTRAYDQDWVAEANKAQLSRSAVQDPAALEYLESERTGTGDVRLHQIRLSAPGVHDAAHASISHGDSVEIIMAVAVVRACQNLVVSYHVKNAQNQNVLGGNTGVSPGLYSRQWQHGDEVSIRFRVALPLHAGTYSVTVLATSISDTHRYTDAVFHDWVDAAASLQVAARSEFPLSDLVELPHQIEILPGPSRPTIKKNSAPAWVVLDDFFPHLLSAFRIAEYNAYLEAFPELVIESISPEFAMRHAEYAQLYPGLAPRVRSFEAVRLGAVDFAYLNFLNNAFHFLPLLLEAEVDFVLTLYPGGGFGLNEPQSDAKLLAVLGCKRLKALIVTQPVTERYVQSFALTHGLRLPPVHFVAGLVVHPHYWSSEFVAHGPYFGAGKATLDICFVAEKYMPQAQNKGYPEFIQAALALGDVAHLRFHVVGSLVPEDLDVSGLDGRIQFHGRLETVQLQAFFANQDLIVSPNLPGRLHPGNFDGFPTGCCVEASLSGVGMVVADVLQQNPGYQHNVDIWIVPPDAVAIECQIREILAHPGRLALVAEAGQAVTRTRYQPEMQIAPRIAVLRQALEAVAKPSSTHA